LILVSKQARRLNVSTATPQTIKHREQVTVATPTRWLLPKTGGRPSIIALLVILCHGMQVSGIPLLEQALIHNDFLLDKIPSLRRVSTRKNASFPRFAFFRNTLKLCLFLQPFQQRFSAPTLTNLLLQQTHGTRLRLEDTSRARRALCPSQTVRIGKACPRQLHLLNNIESISIQHPCEFCTGKLQASAPVLRSLLKTCSRGNDPLLARQHFSVFDRILGFLDAKANIKRRQFAFSKRAGPKRCRRSPGLEKATKHGACLRPMRIQAMSRCISQDCFVSKTLLLQNETTTGITFPPYRTSQNTRICVSKSSSQVTHFG
jgi:hypothetical protein